ncbi:hypothetical protein [Chitinophaga vietnamensis]|uniref:hypothetical protein n=1 Tax=Chitinophaga vietnamensis TaxID=2593957 RepID=UPI0011787287|nr:hypothetical protein [Chitinophaga vietnamensis]
MKKQANKEASTAWRQRKKKPVKILDTDKGGVTRNPLHGDLSSKPEEENKAVRYNEEKDKR